MTTTWMNKSAKWLMVGALAANLCNAETPLVTIPEGFAQSEAEDFKSIALPEPACNTKQAAKSLQDTVRLNPLPTFDGVSPWPGLYGFWIHQRAGIYLVVRGEYTYVDNSVTNRASNRQKVLRINVRVYSLCTNETLHANELLASGTSVFAPGEIPKNSIRVKLGNHSLNNVVRPYATLTRIGDSNSQKPIKDVIGLTLQFRLPGAERGKLIKESILLRNVLNL